MVVGRAHGCILAKSCQPKTHDASDDPAIGGKAAPHWGRSVCEVRLRQSYRQLRALILTIVTGHERDEYRSETMPIRALLILTPPLPITINTGELGPGHDLFVTVPTFSAPLKRSSASSLFLLSQAASELAFSQRVPLRLSQKAPNYPT